MHAVRRRGCHDCPRNNGPAGHLPHCICLPGCFQSTRTKSKLILQTKIDFTLCRGVLAAVFFVFFFFGLGIAILPLFGPKFGVNIEILHLVYSAIGVLIFSVYLIYDTQVEGKQQILIKICLPQMMMGGNHKFSISPEEYIFAAIAIYLDILNLFLHILKLVAAARRK